MQNIEEINIEVVIKIDFSDSDIAIRIGAVMGVAVMEMIVYIFITKRYLGVKKLR